MKYQYLILFSIACIFLGCKQEETISFIEMKGEWHVYNALRNDKLTKTLEGGYFVFEDDNTMKTNIFGDEKIFTFEYKDNYLITSQGEPKMNLKLISSHPDSIQMKGKIKYFNFEFFLARDTIE